MTDTLLQFFWATINIVLVLFAYVVPKPIRFPHVVAEKVERFVYFSGVVCLIFLLTNVSRDG